LLYALSHIWCPIKLPVALPAGASIAHEYEMNPSSREYVDGFNPHKRLRSYKTKDYQLKKTVEIPTVFVLYNNFF